jgi:hypothetical protein
MAQNVVPLRPQDAPAPVSGTAPKKDTNWLGLVVLLAAGGGAVWFFLRTQKERDLAVARVEELERYTAALEGQAHDAAIFDRAREFVAAGAPQGAFG